MPQSTEKTNKTILYGLLFVTLIIVSLPAISTTLFYQAPHDTLFHTQRILSVSTALENGHFPIRIFGDQMGGYGYGTPLFYSSLFLILPGVLHNLGLPLVFCYNIFLILINAATLLVGFYSFKTITKSPEIGCISAILYSVCTYRLEDLYVRGSMGEFLALIFLPLCLCGLICIARGEYHRWGLIVAGFTGVLQSHTLSFLMITAVAVIYVLAYKKGFWNKMAILSLLKSAAFFLLLNLWYLIPFLDAYRLPLKVRTTNTYFWYTDASLIQLFDVLKLSVNGGEVFTDLNTNSMPKTPGVLLLFGAILALFGCIQSFGEQKKSMAACKWFLLPAFLFTIMTTNLFPWKIIEQIPFINKIFASFQFMWRFNILGILFLSIAAGYGLYHFFIKDSASMIKSLVILGLLLGFSSCIFMNQLQKNVEQYREEYVIANGMTDELYLTTNSQIPEEKTINAINAETFRYSNLTNEYLKCEFDFTASECTNWEIELPFTYYPGYQVKVNNQKIPVSISENGLLKASLSPDMTKGTMKAYYSESVLYLIADFISLFTLLVCIFFTVRVTKGHSS